MRQPSYRLRVAHKIKHLVQHADTFLDVCSSADGVLPSEIIYILKELNEKAPNHQIRRIIDSAFDEHENEAASFPQMENLLIDYDWRFQKSSSERLFKTVREFKSVLCMGTPTIFALLADLRKTDLLIERNSLYRSLISVSGNHAIFHRIEDASDNTDQRFEAAVLDPPWYLDSYCSWLKAALSFVNENGYIYFPIFPTLLREEAEQELSTLFGWLTNVGPVSILPFCMKYETPSFEATCLRSSGLPALHGWRTTKIAALRVENSTGLDNAYVAPKAEEKWSRYLFKNRTTAAVKQQADFVSGIEAHFFIDSISRRDERRQLITAVSSRNMAARTDKPRQLERTLKALSLSSEQFEDPLLTALSKGEFAHA